ncbi:hypothetical protein MLD38_034220 [Melastoma candidum]|uniref:Uncharacterized protein n=1 Tax=Melastoma candidum TaxID=119954 RepID=A0ACB9MAL8_9MYRT|nr:hypothetical protein MLD38_034220 [Melastoma candidum]
MHVLPQRCYFSSSGPSRGHVRPAIRCLASTSAARRPAPTSIDDPSLQSTWSHRAWLTSGCATIAVTLGKSALAAVASSSSSGVVEPGVMVAGLAGYFLADLGSGVYHWGIDNYGNASTPVFGSQIEAFQGHHKWPWTITRRQVANNLHALARAVAFSLLPFDLLCEDATVLCFAASFAGFIMMSQQFHSWAHSTKSRLPPIIVALQDAGVLVSRAQHAAHHRPPYNNNYCIVSGAWNRFLDENRVFEVLEMAIYFRYGVRPRSWSEPGSDWTEEGPEEEKRSLSPQVVAQAQAHVTMSQ